MKKAIVLLMTIGFIAIISALVLISLSISKKSFDQAVYIDAQNQFSVVFKDFVKILNSNSQNVKNEDDLFMLLSFSMPAMIEPKTGVEVGFLLESQMGKLNINYMLDQIVKDVNDENASYIKEPLMRFFDQFELKETATLLDILIDTIDKDDLERGAYTELAAEDFDFREGRIYSFRHLKKIFDHYYRYSYDPNVYRIEKDIWDETFYFGDTNSSHQLLDCNQLDMTPAINLLTNNRYQSEIMVDFCDEFNETVIVYDDYLKKLKQIYNISSFDKNKQYLLKCDIIFNTENFKRNVTFDYDITTAEITNIDKNFQDE